MGKLATAGVNDTFLSFLNDYLEPRIGHVAVGGVLSDMFIIADTVFQGTVLGPVLWNIFFNDVVTSASWFGGEPRACAVQCHCIADGHGGRVL